MKYLIAASLILCALILSRKPKEPGESTSTKGKVSTANISKSSRS